MQNKHVSRAKLFLSFDSLKGFKNYLKEKERIVVEEKELAQDSLDLLDYKIHQIKKGDMVKIIYYDQMAYIQKEGKVAKIDLEYAKTIQIVDSVIPLKDIVFIEF